MSDTKKNELLEDQVEALNSDGELSEEELEWIAGGIRQFGLGMLPPSLMSQLHQLTQGGAPASTSGSHQEVVVPDGWFEQGGNFDLLGGQDWTPQQEAALQTILRQAQSSPQGQQMLQSMQQQMLQAQMGNVQQGPFHHAPSKPKESALPSWVPSLSVKVGEDKATPSNSWEQNRKYGETKKNDDGKGGPQSYGPGSFGLNSYGKGATLSEGGVHLFEAGKVDRSTSGNWGKLSAKGDTRFLEARGRTYNFANLDLTKGDFALGIGAQGQANLLRANYTGKYETKEGSFAGKPVKFSASTGVEARIGAQGDAEASIILGKNPRIKIGAGAWAGARVDTNATLEGTAMGLSAKAKGDAWAWAGAQGEATMELGKNGLTAGVGGFAGASAGVKGSAELGGVGVYGKAEAWAGIGAKAKFDASFKNGKLKFGGEIGAALGIGGSTSWGVTLDVGKTIKEVQKFGESVETLAKDVGDKIEDTAEDVAQEIESGFKKVGKGITNVAKDVGKGIEKVGKKIGSGLKKAFSGW